MKPIIPSTDQSVELLPEHPTITKVLEQNKLILEMNQLLIECMARPAWIIREVKK